MPSTGQHEHKCQVKCLACVHSVLYVLPKLACTVHFTRAATVSIYTMHTFNTEL